MDATPPTGRLRAWLREAMGVVRDAVAEAPEPSGPRPLGARSQIPESLLEAFAPRAWVGDGGLIACWAGLRAQLDAAVEAFVAGQPVSIALVGDTGSGRDVLLDHIERRVRRAGEATRTARVNAPRAGLREALEASLPVEARRAVFVGGAHHAYRRRIGGFAELREALDLMTDTVGSTLWAVEFDTVPWWFLDRVYQVAAQFTHVVFVPALDTEDFSLALQRRIASLAGSAWFEFPVPANLPLEDHPLWARGGFAARLHRASRGNPQAGGELFLRLATQGAEGAYTVEPPPELVLGDLGAFPPQHVVALELLLGHTSLTSEELGDLLGLAPSEARAALEGLTGCGLVRGDRHLGYAVDPVWRGPLIEHLRSKNLL